MELSEALFSLVHAVRKNMKHEIKQLALDLSPMHLKSLKVISLIDGCTGQKLADFMDRDKAQINRLIKELVHQELIIKTDNEQDKRSQHIVLSSKGEEMMKMFKNVEKNVFNRMVNDIPSAQIEDFIDTIQLLKINLG
ncbi:MarR family winged helix-turn-helix transcriptional regulator [Thalassotalea profundi]|uniref:HTH marR-type domain-containing protein n=1 Tax=Thalassotalea profundi TaxID=2036687 RepID=A0ABQ3IV95_9GAMM|nr:MarR family transcriptional regulator [Thalassotalea profundi]GHE94838.1 hypothetical protein GCM10011501_25400 [Thalassotalea profundi]